MPKSKRKSQSKLNESVKQKKQCENDKNEINISHQTSKQSAKLKKELKNNKNEQNNTERRLEVKLFDILKCSEKYRYLRESENYLTPKQKKQYTSDRTSNKSTKLAKELKNNKNEQNIHERTLKVKLFDGSTPSKKYPNLSESISDLTPTQNEQHSFLIEKQNTSFKKKKTYPKKLNMENIEVLLCDIFICSETNCFQSDDAQYMKTCQVQLSEKRKNLSKYHISNFVKNKKQKGDNEATKKEHNKSTRSKRVHCSEKDSDLGSVIEAQTETDTESNNGSESLYDVIRAWEYSFTSKEASSDYELISEDEETEFEESDRESVTETETETDTESNSDPESVYAAVEDDEYIPDFENEEKVVESCSESDTETEEESYSVRDTDSEVESDSKSRRKSKVKFSDTDESNDSESGVESDSKSQRKSKVKFSDTDESNDSESEVESDFKCERKSKVKSSDTDETNDSESEENPRPVIRRTRGSDSDRKRKRHSKREEQKKFRKWRLKSLKIR